MRRLAEVVGLLVLAAAFAVVLPLALAYWLWNDSDAPEVFGVVPADLDGRQGGE